MLNVLECFNFDSIQEMDDFRKRKWPIYVNVCRLNDTTVGDSFFSPNI